MRTLLASLITLSVLSGAPVQAMDLRTENPLLHHVAWDQEQLETQIRNVNYLRSRVEKLEIENEQLRNSIMQMRSGREEQGAAAYDIRLQALIEENKRLSNKLALSQDAGKKHPAIPNPYAQRLYLLENENTKLQQQIGKIVAQTELKFQGQIEQYEQENLRLKSALSVGNHKKTDELIQAQQRVSFLESENVRLLAQSKTKTKPYTQNNSKALQVKNQEIRALQTSIDALKSQNSRLSATLSDQASLINGYQNKAGQSAQVTNTSNRKIGELEQKISTLTRKNADLSIRLQDKTASLSQGNATLIKQLQGKAAALSQENVTLQKQLQDKTASLKVQSLNTKEVTALKQQNKSLRDTIRAQNDVLKSTDNAAKTAEHLITENRMLKVKLKKAGAAKSNNNKAVQQLLTRNQILENQMAGKEGYIKKLEGLKATVKQLRQENDKYAMGQMTANSMQAKVSTLEEQNAAYQVSLNKERASIIEYRKKIREYQDNIQSLNTQNETMNNDVVQSYKQKIDNLEQQSAQQNSIETQLRLETQNLKAQLTLLEQNLVEQKQQLKEMNKNHTAELASLKKKNKKQKNVKYIETSYPSVDKVKPLLDESGSHLFDKGPEDIAPSKVSAEDILSEDLKPLSNLNK
ncbi:MAG: hypothetical protein ACRBCK_06095 [Alphaproteobacteria bacterium]